MDTTPAVALPKLSYLPALPGGDLLLLAFYVILAFYVVFTVVLYYHFYAYASEKSVAFTTGVIYLFMTVPMIIILATCVALT